MKISVKIVFKNSLLNIAGEGFPSVVAIIILPFLIRSLGQDRFGLLMLIFAIQGYLQFINLRLGYALTKYAAEAICKGEHARLSQLTWTTIAFLFFLGIIGCLILVITARSGFINIFKIPDIMWAEARLSLLFTAFSIPLTFVNSGFRALLAAGQRFDLINIVNASTGSFRYISALLFALNGFYLPVIMLVLLMFDLLRFAIYLIICFNLYPSIRKFSFDIQASRSLIWFGGWLSVSHIVGMAVHYADRFIISGVLPIAQLTYYSAPSEIINRFGLISQSVDKSIFPVLSARARTKEALHLYARTMKLFLIAAAPLVLTMFFFSHDLLKLYVGKEIAKESYPVLQWLSFGFLVSIFGAITHNYVLALGYPNKVAKFHLVELALYICIALPLTVKLGIKGMAIAWFLRRILETSYFFIVLKRALPGSFSVLISNGINKALIIIIALGALFISTSVFGEALAGIKIVTYSSGIIAYCIFSWVVVFTKQERVSVIRNISVPLRSFMLIR